MVIPKNYKIVCGKGVGKYELLAFDNALLNAGIGDYNLVKVSSILPAGCQYKNIINIEKGDILYAAYASDIVKNGERNTLSVAVAVAADRKKNGVIFEMSSKNDCTENDVREMCLSAMKERDREFETILSASITVDGSVEGYVCGIAAVVMW